jgi:hypothetical protein
MGQKEILNIMNAVKPELWWFLLQTIIALGIMLALKNFIDSCVNYLYFMINKRLSINVKVEIRGKRGVITGYTRRWIFIRTEDNCDILVNMRRWEYEAWVIVDPYKMT